MPRCALFLFLFLFIFLFRVNRKDYTMAQSLLEAGTSVNGSDDRKRRRNFENINLKKISPVLTQFHAISLAPCPP